MVYIGEKSFILGLGLVTVLVPSLGLTAASFDWDYVNLDGDVTSVSAYWIQCYLMIYLVEIVDCLAILDAGFMLSYCLAAVYFMWGSRNGRNKKFGKVSEEVNFVFLLGVPRIGIKLCVEIVTGFCCISLSIVFVMILMEFAESGFFSPTNRVNAGFLTLWSFICKMFIGFNMIQCSKEMVYGKLQRIFGKGDAKVGDEQILSDQEHFLQN